MNAPGVIEPQRMTLRADVDQIVIKGSAVVFTTLRPHGFRPVYIGGSLGGWVMDRSKRGRDRLPDVLAILQSAGHKVTVVEVVEVAQVAAAIVAARVAPVADVPELVPELQGSLW